jgi:hypothetical protein
VRLDDAIAAVAAALPVTPERAAANARVLDEEVAAYLAAREDDGGETAA